MCTGAAELCAQQISMSAAGTGEFQRPTDKNAEISCGRWPVIGVCADCTCMERSFCAGQGRKHRGRPSAADTHAHCIAAQAAALALHLKKKKLFIRKDQSSL